MNNQSCKYSCKNRYLQILIHRGSTSACREKFTVMTTRNVCGKQHGVWGAQKPCAMRADTSIDFPSLTRAFSTCSKRLFFEHPHYRKFTDTCGCNPILIGQNSGGKTLILQASSPAVSDTLFDSSQAQRLQDQSVYAEIVCRLSLYRSFLSLGYLRSTMDFNAPLLSLPTCR